MSYLTNKELQIIKFLIEDGIKVFDFRGSFYDCWFTVKESNELAKKQVRQLTKFGNAIVMNFGNKTKRVTEFTI